jgi:hypothetical protein
MAHVSSPCHSSASRLSEVEVRLLPDRGIGATCLAAALCVVPLRALAHARRSFPTPSSCALACSGTQGRARQHRGPPRGRNAKKDAKQDFDGGFPSTSSARGAVRVKRSETTRTLQQRCSCERGGRDELATGGGPAVGAAAAAAIPPPAPTLRSGLGRRRTGARGYRPLARHGVRRAETRRRGPAVPRHRPPRTGGRSSERSAASLVPHGTACGGRRPASARRGSASAGGGLPLAGSAAARRCPIVVHGGRPLPGGERLGVRLGPAGG